MSESQPEPKYPKFELTYAKAGAPRANLKPDTRTYVDRMFENHDFDTAERTLLPIRAQDGSKLGKISDAVLEANTMPLILSVGAENADFAETNNLPRGEHILVIGGNRQAKASLGKLMIPLNQVQDFCERLQAAAEAARNQVPELLKRIAASKV